MPVQRNKTTNKINVIKAAEIMKKKKYMRYK